MWHGYCFGIRMIFMDALLAQRPILWLRINGRTMKTTAITEDDVTAIRELENNFAAAFNAGNVDAMMQNYIPDNSLVVFDVVPRKNYFGADEYRRNWTAFFAHFNGPPKISITNLNISVDVSLAFSYSIQHVTGTDTQGRPVDRTVRVTDGYRKIEGKWLIIHEHVSLPVDLNTNKPANSK
jgi:uncharacterized protein (TIGR02246 family)